ncbi:MAG: hypothetical protein AAF352_04540 [Pseudomonadota bacterium]
MSFTDDDINRIERAIANGVQTVKQGERLVTYASLDEMTRVRDRMVREIANQNGNGDIIMRPIAFTGGRFG